MDWNLLGIGQTVEEGHSPVDWNLLGIGRTVEEDHSPVDWNLLGIGGSHCIAMDANPVTAEVESCAKDHFHCEGQDRLGNAEDNRRVDD